MTQNIKKYSIKQTKDYVQFVIESNRKNRKKGIVKKEAVNIVGEAGLGKTSGIIQLAEELGIKCYKLNLSQFEDLGDLIGFPIKKFYIKKGNEEKLVAEKLLLSYLKKGWTACDRDPVTSHAQPEYVANFGKSGILLLDDWTRADLRFMQAIMELIDRGTYQSWIMPEDWHIMLTSNPDNGEYIVNSTDKAIASRFQNLEVKYCEQSFAEWAENNHIDPRCINFMLLNPEVVDAPEGRSAANPRQWVSFFNLIGNFEDFQNENSLVMIKDVGNNNVGPELTEVFISFIHNNLDKLIEPSRMVLDKDEDKIFKEIKECIGEGNKYRNDIASILAIRFMNWITKYANDNPITDEHRERIAKIIIGEMFGADLSYTIVKKINFKHRNKFNRLIAKPEVAKYLGTS